MIFLTFTSAAPQSQHIVFLLRQPWSRMRCLAVFLALHRNRMMLCSVSVAPRGGFAGETKSDATTSWPGHSGTC